MGLLQLALGGTKGDDGKRTKWGYGSGENRVSALQDMLDGGGAGRAGDTFQGGPVSGLLNTIGVRPMGYRDRLAARQAAPAPAPAAGGGASANPPAPMMRPVPSSVGGVNQVTPHGEAMRFNQAPGGVNPVTTYDEALRFIMQQGQANPLAAPAAAPAAASAPFTGTIQREPVDIDAETAAIRAYLDATGRPVQGPSNMMMQAEPEWASRSRAYNIMRNVGMTPQEIAYDFRSAGMPLPGGR